MQQNTGWWHGLKAIRYELARFNIKVNVVCPGYTITNFHDHQTFRRRNPYRKKNTRSLTGRDVSIKILDTICKDRVVTFVPWWYRWVVWILNVMPIISIPLWNRILEKRINQLYEQIALEKSKLP
jgi:short-subunit dehydrogenase